MLTLMIFLFHFLLIITVCKSVVGLSILVYMIRFYGNNKVNWINLIK